MNDVKFNISREIQAVNPNDGSTVTSGVTSFLVDAETGQVVSSTTSGSFFGEDAHTSKDEYIVVSNAYGKTSQAGKYNGFSPTEEIFFEDFTWSGSIKDEPGKQILLSGVDFEDGTLQELAVESNWGGGSLLYNGVRNSTELEGDFYYALRSAGSNDWAVYIKPNLPAASGMQAGRAIFLMKNNGDNSGSNDGQVGFAFMRQGTTVNADGYHFFSFTNFSSTNFDNRMQRGEINDPGGTDLDEAFNIIGSNNINFNSGNDRQTNHRIWYMVEWDAFDTDNTLIQFSHQLYEDGDTIENIQDSWIPFYQVLDSQSPYNSAPETPIWQLVTRNNSAGGDVGLDQVYLEKLTPGSLDSGGLRNWKVIHPCNASNTTRYLRINNIGCYSFNDLPNNDDRNGLPALGNINPLVPEEEALVPLDGRGFTGLDVLSVPNDVSVSNRAHAILEPRTDNPNLAGITKGVIRTALRFGTGAGDLGNEIAISIMRQGSAPNSDAYTLLMHDAGSDNVRLRLRKGTIINNLNISGQRIINSGASTLASSSVLLNTPDIIEAWVEFRWEVLQSGFTRLEVLYSEIPTDFNPVDTSPGNVDFKLTQVISYLDITSPYTTTTEAPCFYFSHALSGATNSRMYRCEIRRAK